MKRAFVLIIAAISLVCTSQAQKPSTLEQARQQANQQKKAILIEFFQPDCEFCQQAIHDFAANDTILALMKSIVYLPLDVNLPEGERLSKTYFVQNDYPVFALTDSSGEIIDHWTGYSNAALFAQRLNKSLADPVTIQSRYKKFESAPTPDEAIFLAKYYNEIGDDVKSAELYRRAQTLRNSPAYLYDIFQNTANAVWKGNLPFEQLIPAADDVLVAQAGNPTQVAGVARIISNVARKTGNTSEIARYLQAGIDISKGRNDIRSKDWYTLFTADRALYVEHDTTGATSIEKANLGAEWENKPGKFYSYAKWCLERKINLAEAEDYARQAVDRASEGKFRASTAVTLAGIYEARGNLAEAANTMEMAVKQDPSNIWYASEAKRLRGMVNGNK